MFKRAMGAMVATTYAAADINTDFKTLLHGENEMRGLDLANLWSQFQEEFGEASPVSLGLPAMTTFFANVDSIIEHNSKADKTFSRGINKFSAMTSAEFNDFFHLSENQANAAQNCSATNRSSPLTANGSAAPDEWNWVNHGGVSPVKDQGSCGSCWTFSTVGCLESAHLIQEGRLETYAEQQLVDCAGDFENYGCSGGLPSHAFEYIYYAGGIATETAYPYYAEDRTCTVDSADFALSVGHATNITEGDETELKSAVFQQPVSVAFQVADDFSSYTSGVYTSTICGNTAMDVNHAVLAVGYGNDPTSGLDYWLIKNSWSADWGMDGFFMIERGVNMCGIAMCNSYPESVAEIDAIDFWMD